MANILCSEEFDCSGPGSEGAGGAVGAPIGGGRDQRKYP